MAHHVWPSSEYCTHETSCHLNKMQTYLGYLGQGFEAHLKYLNR